MRTVSVGVLASALIALAICATLERASAAAATPLSSGGPFTPLAVEPTVSIADALAFESDGAAARAVFAVTLSEPSGGPVTVAFAPDFELSTATSDDLSAPSGTLTFAPGETVKAITVPVYDDALTTTRQSSRSAT